MAINTWDISNRLVADLQQEFGISKGTAQGIVGALAMESGGFKQLQERNPIVPGSRGGYGFAQWTGVRRREFESFAAKHGLDPASYEANQAYLFEELKGVGNHDMNVLAKLQGVTDPQAAQEIFTNTFLRPGIPHMDQRAQWTRMVVANDAPVPPGSIPGGAGSQDSSGTFQLANVVPLDGTPPARPEELAGIDSAIAAVAQLALGGDSGAASGYMPGGGIYMPEPEPVPEQESPHQEFGQAPVPPQRPEGLEAERQEAPIPPERPDGLDLESLLVSPTPPERPKELDGRFEDDSGPTPPERPDDLVYIPDGPTPPPRPDEFNLSATTEPEAEAEAEDEIVEPEIEALIPEGLDFGSPEIKKAEAEEILATAGRSAPQVTDPEDFSLPDLNALGEFAPKIDDLDAMMEAHEQLKQSEIQMQEAAQSALAEQSKIAAPEASLVSTPEAITAPEPEEEEFNFGKMLEDAFDSTLGMGTRESPGLIGSIAYPISDTNKGIAKLYEDKTRAAAKEASKSGKDIAGNPIGTKYVMKGTGKEVTPQIKVKKEDGKWVEYVGYS